MRVYLDDIRLPPDDYDVWCRTAEAAITLIQSGKVTHISLDHDLGDAPGRPSVKTGYDVAITIEKLAANAHIPPMTWSVHSANPPGAARIRSAMKSADKFWAEYNDKHPDCPDNPCPGRFPYCERER